MGKILLVDDESSIAWAFRKLITSMGHEFVSAPTAEEGVQVARRESPDLIFMDVRLPGKDGLWAVKEIRESHPHARIVVLTAHGTLDTAVRSMQLGAVEYLAKPVDVDRARQIVKDSLGPASPEAAEAPDAGTSGMIGKSAGIQEVFRKVAAVSQSDATVLLCGESGTGKELLARAIYQGGARAGAPFEAINCAAIPETLIESELYGHEEGAFTGAVRRKKGKFEISAGGTVFLDEIGDLSPAAQVKMLRVLEDGSFERVGGTENLKVDVRILAATNQNLEEKIAQGGFREDLYFRLNVVRIDVPPLRDRPDDIPLLVAHFVRRNGAAGVAEEAMELLKTCPWPGNVRELKSAIERGAVLARGRVISREHLPESVLSPRPADDLDARIDAVIRELLREDVRPGEILKSVETRWERALLRRVLEKAEGSQSEASRLLGMSRATLRKRLRQYGL